MFTASPLVIRLTGSAHMTLITALPRMAKPCDPAIERDTGVARLRRDCTLIIFVLVVAIFLFVLDPVSGVLPLTPRVILLFRLVSPLRAPA
jgi:hypothetical protein